MSKRSLPPPELLLQLLRYEPETGKLFWRARPREMFDNDRLMKRWNTRYANKEAFTCILNGYYVGAVLAIPCKAHRVIWAMETGVWPENDIDHINRNRSDNRFSNLRSATRSENSKNVCSLPGSTSAYIGVSWHRASKRWIAQVSVNGKSVHLGCFNCEIEAAKAYDAAARFHYGEFANPNF